MQILGIDIGGSGIKGAPVDIGNGRLLAERLRIPTPRPSTPRAVGVVVNEICSAFDWDGPVGCGFPSVIQHGIVRTAANVNDAWIDAPGERLLSDTTGLPVRMVNDADAAGLAEIRFGAGKDQPGVVFVLTIGTGIGSALFVDGTLVPNLELGHMKMRGKDAEHRVSDKARKRDDLSWRRWATRFNRYLEEIDDLFWPELVILGGGAAKKHERFMKYIRMRCPVVPASFRNNAGIVGAALAAVPPLKDPV